MTDVLCVARKVADLHGPMTAMKLQKLVYYCQAWHLVWDEAPLFDEDFEAWANGPVSPKLYSVHRGQFIVSPETFPEGHPLDEAEIGTIEAVMKFYGDKSAQWLSDLTHAEDPWVEARGETPSGERCSAIISKSSMHEYYSGLQRP